nr:class I SAM-dependent methyltransferase [Anaerolineae bacterium]
FAPGKRVLDVGAGPSCNMARLMRLGVDVYGVEPCAELRAAGLQRCPELAGRLVAGSLPDLGRPFGGEFDGVLCSAVLMHLPREEVGDAALALRGVLRPGGVLLLSVPLARPGISEDGRDDKGRLFTPLPEEWLEEVFGAVGLALVEQWHAEDAVGREGVRWCTLLWRRPG